MPNQLARSNAEKRIIACKSVSAHLLNAILRPVFIVELRETESSAYPSQELQRPTRVIIPDSDSAHFLPFHSALFSNKEGEIYVFRN